ncbi:MAG: hypothetical protein JWN63_560 [Candidatus Acidoferrum typicum]|nr:hypothetical protein [Candidatus Acidoferrum typicum]
MGSSAGQDIRQAFDCPKAPEHVLFLAACSQ